MQEQVSVKELTAEQEFTLMQKIGGKKFILSMTVVLITSLLTWFSKIEPGIYSVVIVAVVGAFVAGDVIQNVQSGGSLRK